VRRELKVLVCLTVLGAVGFASASIVNGANALTSATTGTTATTATAPSVTVTTTKTVTRRVFVTRPQTVLLCHRTASGRFLTIRVRLSVGVLAAHLRHGDATGRCTAAKVRLMKKQLHSKRG
jgi:hypothetical protein